MTEEQTKQQYSKEQHSEPEFPRQDEEHPGLDSEMRPESGYEAYRGFGGLKGKVAIITGGGSVTAMISIQGIPTLSQLPPCSTTKGR